MPAPPSEPPPREDGDRDSTMQAVRSASSLADELGARGLALKAADLARVEAVSEAAELRRQLKEANEASRERAQMRAKWEKLGLKLAGGFVSLLVALCGYGAWRLYQLEHRTESTEEHVITVKTKAEVGRDIQKETLEFLVAWQAYQDCVNGQQASATVRGTGHKLSGVPSVEILWYEQNKPPTRPGPLWTTWSWTPIKDCGAEPHVPSLPL